MSDMHPAVSSFFDQLSTQMQDLLAGVHADGTSVSWTAASELPPDLAWWSCGISVDPGVCVFAGTTEADWTGLGAAFDTASDIPFAANFGGVVKSIEQAVQTR